MSQEVTLFTLLRCKLNKTQKDQFFFPSTVARDSYFSSLWKKEAYEWQWVRRDGLAGQVKVPYRRDDISNLNYGFYDNQGTAAYTKTFFFVDKMEYVNDKCTLVTFTVDVIQSYMDALEQQKTVFVERMVDREDEYRGDKRNTLPEPIDAVINGYQLYKYAQLGISGGAVPDYGHLVIVSNASIGENRVTNYGGIAFKGVQLYYFSSITEYNNFLSSGTTTRNVLASYPVPKQFAPPTLGNGEVMANTIPPNREYALASEYAPDVGAGGMDGWLGGYYPVNHKLYCYPYCGFWLGNGAGQHIILKYEEWDGDMKLVVRTSLMPPYTLSARPLNYHGGGDGGQANPEDVSVHMDISANPEDVISEDALLRYVSDNVIGFLLGGVKLAALPAMATATPVSTMKTAAGVLEGVVDFADGLYQASRQPDYVEGSPSGNLPFMNRQQDFFIAKAVLTRRQYQEIDDFFTMYGYSTNRLVNLRDAITAGTYHSYVKTRGFTPTFTQPPQNDAIVEITRIFERGIRFWKMDTALGDSAFMDFSLNNRE